MKRVLRGVLMVFVLSIINSTQSFAKITYEESGFVDMAGYYRWG